MLAGASTGGIFRSTDAGLSWAPVGDTLPAMDIHTLALDPANPNVVYAGTGDWHPGVGILRSADFGLTWQHLPASLGLGLRVTGIVVSPADGRLIVQSDININSLGYLGARAGRVTGIHVSLDRGATFTRTLDPQPAGWEGSGLSLSPHDPAVVLAAATGVIHRSTDGGRTWLPAVLSPLQQYAQSQFIRVAFAPSTPGIAYALTTGPGNTMGSLYRSTDGGATFTRMSSPIFQNDGVLPFRALWVNPRNADHVIVGAGDVRESLDAGVTWTVRSRLGVDFHALVNHPGFDNASNRRLFMLSDRGVEEVADTAQPNAANINRSSGLANLQFYSGSANAGSRRIVAGAQDRSVYELTLDTGTWRNVQSGADGLQAVADPRTPDRVYTAGLIGERLVRADTVLPGGGLGGTDLQRCGQPPPFRMGDDCSSPWAFPFTPFLQLDPRNPDRLYVGTGWSVWRTENAADALGADTGPRWTKILDAAGGALGVYAMSPADPEVIWAADMGVTGQIRRTTQASAPSPVWQSAGVLGPGEIWSITAHPTLSIGAYVTRSRGQAGRTLDGGATWQSISGAGATALPAVNIHRIVPHPLGTHYLYAATDLGLFVSEDAGASWLAGASPANVPIYDLFFMGTDTLVAVTYGRSIFTAPVPPPLPPQTPGAPSGLAADVQGNAVTLQWRAGAGAAATQYRIQAGSSPGLSNIAVVNTGTPSTTFAAGVVPNGTYHVRVFGVNGFGASEPSNELALVVPVPVPPPGAPGPLVGTVTGTNVSLTWGASSGTVTDYVLEAGTAPGQSNVLMTSLGSVTSFAATNVFPGTYFVRMRARNGGGLSGPSNEVILNVGVTGCTAAPAPPVLAAPVVTGRTVSLAWTAPPGPVAGYVIEAGYSAGTTIVTLPVAAGATSLQVNAGAGTYFVRMRARNACGTSVASSEITVVVR